MSDKPTITTEQMLKPIEELLGHIASDTISAKYTSPARVAIEAIRTRLLDYDSLKERYLVAADNIAAKTDEVCSLRIELANATERAKSLEAEVKELNADIEVQKKFVTKADEWFDKWQKAEAEVELARPLLDAAMGVDAKEIYESICFIKVPGDVGAETILEAALAYRKEKDK